MTTRIASTLTMLIAALIAYGALTPPGGYNLTTGPASLFDKHQHVTAFALLVLPLTWVRFRNAFWLVPLALVYGGAIEILQPLVGRSSNLLDLVANSVGVGLGILPGAIRGSRRRRRPNRGD